MKVIQSLAFSLLTVLASSAAFAGSGNTNFGEETAPFFQFACVSNTENTPVSLPDVLPPVDVKTTINGSLILEGSDAKGACWTTLSGGYSSNFAGLNSKETVFLAGHEPSECIKGGDHLRNLFPANSKIKWLDNDTLAIQANIATAGICAHSQEKVFAIFKF